jgi:hypothetical protein
VAWSGAAASVNEKFAAAVATIGAPMAVPAPAAVALRRTS